MDKKTLDLAKSLLEFAKANPQAVEQALKKTAPESTPEVKPEQPQDPKALVKSELAADAKPRFMSAERFAELNKSLKAKKMPGHKESGGPMKLGKEEKNPHDHDSSPNGCHEDCKACAWESKNSDAKKSEKEMDKCGEMTVAKDGLEMSPKQEPAPKENGGQISKDEMKPAPKAAMLKRAAKPAAAPAPAMKAPAMKAPMAKPTMKPAGSAPAALAPAPKPQVKLK